MKAIVVSQPGGPEVLKYTDVPTPKVKPGWSLIKVRGFGINHSEIFTRQGKSPSVKFPRILGIEAVGEVWESTTPKLTKGQKVCSIMGEMGRAYDGSYAEYVLLPNQQIFPVKTKLPWENFAAIPETFYTAYGIFKSLQIKENDSILIRAASSGIGVSLIKLINSLNIKTTTFGTTRSESKVNRLKEFGYMHVLITPNNKLPDNLQFDKIVDLIGPATVKDSLNHLNEFGIVNSSGQLGNQWTIKEFDPIFDIPNNRYLTGFYSGDVNQDKMQEMLNYITSHKIDTTPAKIYKLKDIKKAHEFLDKNHGLGKIVVIP